jgi:hypothetical protein
MTVSYERGAQGTPRQLMDVFEEVLRTCGITIDGEA